MSKAKPFNFEKSLEELNQLVESMEQGQLPLEDSLKQFEKGVGLIRQCQQALQDAEQKVQILTQQDGKEQLTDFQSDE